MGLFCLLLRGARLEKHENDALDKGPTFDTRLLVITTKLLIEVIVPPSSKKVENLVSGSVLFFIFLLQAELNFVTDNHKMFFCNKRAKVKAKRSKLPPLKKSITYAPSSQWESQL